MLPLFYVADEFHDGGREGHCQNRAEGACEPRSDEKGQDDYDWGDADYLTHNQRIYQVALELVDDYVETDDENDLGHAACRQGGDDGRDR